MVVRERDSTAGRLSFTLSLTTPFYIKCHSLLAKLTLGRSFGTFTFPSRSHELRNGMERLILLNLNINMGSV